MNIKLFIIDLFVYLFMGRFKNSDELINKLEELKLSKYNWIYFDPDISREGMDRFTYKSNDIEVRLVVRDWLSFTRFSDYEIINRNEYYTFRLVLFHNKSRIILNKIDLSVTPYENRLGTYKKLFEHVDQIIKPYIRKNKIKNI